MRLALLSMAVCLGTTVWGESHASKKSEGRGSSKALSAGTRHGRRGRGRHSQALRYQLTPTPERYSQIQQALTDRGYYKGAVNGVWGSDSVDAMRRFQADQNLDSDGKLTAKSLGALGLGSKHAAVAQSMPPAGSPSQIMPSGSSPNDHRSPEGSQRP